jgi:hypothetical protein
MNLNIKKFFRKLDSWFFFHIYRRAKVLFYVENAIGLRHQVSLIKNLQHRDDIEVYISVSDNCEIEINQEELGFYNVKRISPKNSRWIKFSCIVATDVYLRWHYRESPVYVIGHGPSIGNQDISRPIWRLQSWRSFNTSICSISSKVEYDHVIKYAEDLLANDRKIFVHSGSAGKKDVDQRKIQELKILLRVTSEKKVILISSHFAEHSLLRNIGIGLIKWLISTFKSLHIIVTGHPKIWIDGLGLANEPDHNLFKELSDLAADSPRISFYSSASDDNLLSLCDYFICDYSSIRVEIAKHEKPVFLYLHPDFRFQSDITGDLYKKSSFCFYDLSDFARKFLLLNENKLEFPEMGNQQFFSYFSGALNPVDSHLSTINALVKIPFIGSKQWTNFREKSLHDLHRKFGNSAKEVI